MHPVCAAVLIGSLLGAVPAASPPRLWTTAQLPDGTPAPAQARPYAPRAGDLVFYHSHSLWWEVMFWVAGTAPPTHCGMVVSLNGAPVLLESAPDDGAVGGYRVCLLEANSRLENYDASMWVRRLKQPLTPEQSARLTQFAVAQEGKPYAIARIVFQITPFRARGPLRRLLGKTDLERSTWICSELVAAGCAAAGLIDGANYPANAIYPRDLFEDRSYDLSSCYEPAEVLHGRLPASP